MNKQETSGSLEGEIVALPGIRGAKVNEGPTGIDSVRVLVVPEKSSDSAIRDVQLKAVQLGISLDPSLIQVLRTGEPQAYASRQRRKLVSVATTRSADGFSARVALELGGDFLIGESDVRQAGRRFERRSVAQATLEGLSNLLDFPVELEAVYVLTVGSDHYMAVILARPDSTLIGSAVIRVDEHDAIARATLDALNRFVSRPLEQQQAAGAL